MGRVVVFGSLNIDLAITVPTLPQAGHTVVGNRLLTFPGGKGCNQAVSAAKLGADVAMVGRVGADGFADRLTAELSAAGVNAESVVRDAETPTGTALIMTDADGHSQIAVAPGANSRVGKEDLERLGKLLSHDTVLLLQMEIPPAAVQGAIALARQAGAQVVFNTAPATGVTPEMLRGADVVVANRNEATAIFDISVVSMGTARRAALRGRQLGAQTILITMGADGSLLCFRDQVIEVTAFKVQSVDATGAGDAYVGALAAALSRDSEIPAAVRLAAAVGAAATLKHGAQSSLPTPAELKQLFGVDWR